MSARPSHSLDVESNRLVRTQKVSNFTNNNALRESDKESGFPLADKQLNSTKAGRHIGDIATDIAAGGHHLQSTSNVGGKNPFHTSALSYETILQNQPKPFFYRTT